MNNQTSQESEFGTVESSQSSTGTGGVKGSVRRAGEKVKSTAKEVASQAQQQGSKYFEQNKARTADRIGHLGESLRHTADRFEEEEDPNIAHYTRLVAGKIEHAAAYVRERDLAQVRHDAEDLARRHPVLFYGGMFTLGLAAARFLKASASEYEEMPVEEQSTLAEAATIPADVR